MRIVMGRILLLHGYLHGSLWGNCTDRWYDMYVCIYFLGLSDLLAFLHSSVVVSSRTSTTTVRAAWSSSAPAAQYYVAHAGGNCSACTDYFIYYLYISYVSSQWPRETIAVGHHRSRIADHSGDRRFGTFLRFYRNKKRL